MPEAVKMLAAEGVLRLLIKRGAVVAHGGALPVRTGAGLPASSPPDP
jgi:hypothetical protein